MSRKRKITKFYKKYHKWIAWVSVFFILMFAVSGVLLNHRHTISKYQVSRSWLPQKYHFVNWNNNAIRGTVKLAENRILMYGSSGVWLTDTCCSFATSFVEGMPQGIDNRDLRAVRKTTTNDVFGISHHDLFRLDSVTHNWEKITGKINDDVAFADLYAKRDTLYVITRSFIYQSTPPYIDFQKYQLKAPTDYSGKVSLFKTMWILHSGEIFGIGGKLLVDLLGVLVIVLCITGILLSLLRVPIRMRRKKAKKVERLKYTWKSSLKWHNKLGYIPFLLLLFLVVSGTFLRPPLLIAIVRAKVPPVPFSTLDKKNPWHNKLRVLRYDDVAKDWLLYSSEGFFYFEKLTDIPQKIKQPPPISVMGVTVLKPTNKEMWLVGSFGGLFLWDRNNNTVLDAFTKKIHKKKKTFGPPVISNPVSGYSDDFMGGVVAYDYNEGAKYVNNQNAFPAMLPKVSNSPMSLWHLSLEVHVGRIYSFFMGKLSVLFIFISGILFSFLLISGYKVYVRKHKKRKR